MYQLSNHKIQVKKYIKAKYSEIRKYHLCLGNNSWDFSANNMKKNGLNGCVYDFSVDHRTFDTCNTIDIHI